LACLVEVEHSVNAQIYAAPAVAIAQLRQLYDREPSTFQAVGPMARQLARLGWFMTTIGVVVFLIVMGLMLWPIWRERNAPLIDEPPKPVNERAWLLYAGAAVPALILAVVFVLTLAAYRSSAPDDPRPLTIKVVGHQWWWEVQYPDQQILTADEIHLPVGRPVKVILESEDVIHSFWVPNIAGKTDAIPGKTNATWLQADTAGVWRGTCAEYCGQQHAHMALSVVAEPPAEFARWTEKERASAVPPADSATLEGEHAFLTSQCVFCHTVRGTQAGGRMGPDLTHIGSRLTIASGTLPNTRGYLAGWIENPDRLKPGTRMPAVPLSGGQLQAIVTYLESLK
jgi:cytochrome c oxidase subunit II